MGKMIRALAYMDERSKGKVDTAVKAAMLAALAGFLAFVGFVAITAMGLDGQPQAAVWHSGVTGITVGLASYYFPRN